MVLYTCGSSFEHRELMDTWFAQSMSWWTCCMFPLVWFVFKPKCIPQSHLRTLTPRTGQMCLGWEWESKHRKEGPEEDPFEAMFFTASQGQTTVYSPAGCQQLFVSLILISVYKVHLGNRSCLAQTRQVHLVVGLYQGQNDVRLCSQHEVMSSECTCDRTVPTSLEGFCCRCFCTWVQLLCSVCPDKSYHEVKWTRIRFNLIK